MSSEVKRYWKETGQVPREFGEHPEGDYVPFADFDRVAADLKRAREALRAAMCDSPGWYDLARAALTPAADRVSCWGMYDCHAFHKFEGKTVDEVFDAWKAHSTRPDQKYGATSLCPVIVLSGQRELRRVGRMIDFDRPNEWHLWLEPVRADAEIARILCSPSSDSHDQA